MRLSTFNISNPTLTSFQTYLLTTTKIKQINKEFDFYNVFFYKKELGHLSTVCLDYPKGNLYWYLDFAKYIERNFINDIECTFVNEWKWLLDALKKQVNSEFLMFKKELDDICPKDIVKMQCLYHLRDYQALDLLQFNIKYKYCGNRGLILSDPRTGKTRVALAASVEALNKGNVILVVCPKSATVSWMKELNEFDSFSEKLFNSQVISRISDIKNIVQNDKLINVRLVSYDLFKRFTIPQVRALISKQSKVMLIGDEIHRLRNFKTQQSQAIFNFKDFCKKDNIDLGIIGLTGTPAVKESSDIFGTLSLINDSKIQFKPYYVSFNMFKEYFYICEDTSFGKIAKALKREDELNFIMQFCSVQTKQFELGLFKNYNKVYKKVELDMDNKQKEIYESVYQDMEYNLDIDCENKLVQLVRLQQICIDPFGLVADYDLTSPKLKRVIKFTLANNFKFIVACKKTTPLKHLMKIFNKLELKYTSLLGAYNYSERLSQIDTFTNDKDIKVMFLQLDTGREALTLPVASAIIFLDRDFAQGFNEQAEARITPVNGKPCTKYIIDLIMKDSKEEDIYNTLVIRKESIDSINTVFKEIYEV